MALDLIQYLKGKKIITDKTINDIYKREINSSLDHWKEHLKQLQILTTRGKNVRSGLYILALEMFGTLPNKKHFEIAAGLEIMHTALLIHDDIMDHDEMRRGIPSIPAYYYSLAQQRKLLDQKDYANSMTICSGDVGIFLAFKILNKIISQFNNAGQMLEYLSSVYLNTGFAQMNDVEYGHSNLIPSMKNIEDLYIYKTAKYTFSLPLVLGFLTVNKGKSITDKLDNLGKNIGLLFQIRDDEIGLFGNPEITGKPRGSDLRENKKTLIRSILIQNCKKYEIKTLENIFSKNSINTRDVEIVYKLIDKYSVIDKIGSLKNQYKQNSIGIVKDLKIDNRFKMLLNELIDYIDKREK